MSDQTPGPWRVENDFKHGPNHYRIFGDASIPDHGNAFVCDVIGTDDARLIAAAPDLLAALKKIVDADYHHTIMGRKDHIPTCPPCIAAAAIAKVNGGRLL